LLGDINPSDEGTLSQASRLLIFNAESSNTKPPLIRDGVGINRVTGAAARAGAVKFDLEVLPPGVTFDLRMELRDPNAMDKQLLAAALAEWKAGRVWLGGRSARGLGAFKLEVVECVERDLNQPSQLMAFLNSPKPWDGDDVKPDDTWVETHLPTTETIAPWPEENDVTVARNWVSFEGTLQAKGPFLTNDTTHAGLSGFDHAPLMVQLGNWDQPVLAGSSLRGVLRSHAERIARTLVTLHNPYEGNSKLPEKKNDSRVQAQKWFLKHCPACDPNARRSGRDLQPDEMPPSLESCDSLLLYQANKGGDENIAPDELCLACRLFGSTRFGSRLVVEDAPFIGDKVKFKMLDFLAVDRFTGGGADHLKFDALVLWRPAFKLRLYLENPQDWELGWLALVLRDLAEGWLSVGYGAAKGFGRVKLTDWTLRYGYLSPDEAPPIKSPPETQGVYTIATGTQSQSEAWLTLAENWVKKFNGMLRDEQTREPKYVRAKDMRLTQDDYYRQVDAIWVNALYPSEVKLNA
jgi:CRISPR/Cas system CSM-associated protein Csm3 (group 7 of RAMP superfamily)